MPSEQFGTDHLHSSRNRSGWNRVARPRRSDVDALEEQREHRLSLFTTTGS